MIKILNFKSDYESKNKRFKREELNRSLGLPLQIDVDSAEDSSSEEGQVNAAENSATLATTSSVLRQKSVPVLE